MSATPADIQDIQNRFVYHPPHGDQVQRYEQLRTETRNLALLILRLCPSSRERSLALTALQEASMWSNAAIAINEKEEPPF